MRPARLDWSAVLRTRGYGWCLASAIWAAVFLTGLGSQELIYEEGRRATPAREMLHTGDFVTPRLYGEAYLHKPPLFFWLVAGCGRLLGGVNELAVRLPSVLSVLAALVVLYRFDRQRLDRATRILAVLFAGVCVMLVEKGRLGEIDAFLSLLVLAALACWWRGETRGGLSIRDWAVIGVLLGVAVLTKGPAGPLLFYLPIVCYCLWERRPGSLLSVGHLLALLLAGAPSVVWLLLLLSQGVVSGDELLFIWRRETGLTLVEAGALPFRLDPQARLAYLFKFAAQLWVGCLPAVLWLLPSRRPLQPGDEEATRLRRFLICAVVPAFLVIGLWPVGRPRHLLVVCYPVCLLAAMRATALANLPENAWHLVRPAAWLPAVLGGVSLAAVACYLPERLALAAGCAVLLGITSWLAHRLTVATSPDGLPLALAGNLLLCVAAGTVCLFAHLPALRGGRAIAQARPHLEELLSDRPPVFTTASYRSGRDGAFSSQFYLGPDLRPLLSLEQLPADERALVVVYQQERDLLLPPAEVAHGRQITLYRRGRDGDPLLAVEVRRKRPVGRSPPVPQTTLSRNRSSG